MVNENKMNVSRTQNYTASFYKGASDILYSYYIMQLRY